MNRADVQEPQLSESEILSEPLTVASELSHWPLAVLDLPIRLENALKRCGVQVLGELQSKTADELLSTAGIGVKGVRQIQNAIHLMTVPNIDKLVERDRSGRSLLPHVSGRMLLAIANAQTLADEIEALFLGLPERNVAMVRQRWASSSDGEPTLESIGQRNGISRERVRQIVGKRRSLVESSNLRLPIAAGVVQLVEESGGAMSTADLIRELKAKNIRVTTRELAVLQTLSEMGITGGRLMYSIPHRLWVSDSGIRKWLDTHKLDEVNQAIRASVRKILKRSGAIRRSDLGSLSPFGLTYALGVALRGKSRALRVGEYVIPIPSLDTSLTRSVEKMLSLTPRLTISDIHAGLRQTIRLEVPPIEVLLAELENHPAFVVNGEHVSATTQRNWKEVLSPSEQVIVEAMDSAGGLLLYTEFTDAVQRAGFSHAMAVVLLRQPFVVRRAVAIYGLRGRSLDSSLMRRKLRERKAARRNEVVRVRRLNADAVEVQFTVTRFSMQGVFALPKEIRRLAIPRWRGVFAGGRERSLQAKNGFIWNVSRGLRDVNAQLGDVVVATFYLAEARVEFNHPLVRRTVTSG
jgi:hypothetical protein